MMRGLLCLLTLSLTLVIVGCSEFCKYQSLKYCFNYCCINSTREYCCPHCHRSVRIDEHPWCQLYTSTTTVPPPDATSWWLDNGWWVELLLRVGLPLGFFLVGGVIILALVCAGKIKLDRVFGRHRRPQPAPMTVQVGIANQPPSYAQATGASYPVQPASAVMVQTTTYPLQQAGPYPVQPPPYSSPEGASYPVQQPYAANSHPPMSDNPNYPLVGLATEPAGK